METANVVIIGAGVIGTAIARELSSKLSRVVLLEQMPKPGMMTSTRNSGVLHGGVYYPPDSLKARFALPGNFKTREFCQTHGVPMRNCGKLIVAANLDESSQLQKLEDQGRANGVGGLRIIGPERIRELEPNIIAAAALEVPTSCVVDAKLLVKAYAGVAASQGAQIWTQSRVTGLESKSDSIVIDLERGDIAKPVKERIEAACVVNAAGLYADEIAKLLDPQAPFRIYPLRGEYARVVPSKKQALVNSLVYPLPHNDVLVREATSRRVHLTRTIDGELLIGPTAKFVADKEDYENDRLPLHSFYEGIHWLLPGVNLADLELAHTGIRPQLIPPEGHGKSDYIIERGRIDARLINLIGMETPGLTAAPSVAQHVASMVAETIA